MSYATQDDPFKNFRQAEVLLGIPVEVSMLIRMSDKFTRISNLIRKGPEQAAVKEESIKDTALDLINYLNLFLAFLDSKKGTGASVNSSASTFKAAGYQ